MFKFVDGVEVPYDSDDIRMHAQDVAERGANLSRLERDKRNSILAATDWTQCVDTPQPIKEKFAGYRSALRDIPMQADFPFSVVWPAAPDTNAKE